MNKPRLLLAAAALLASPMFAHDFYVSPAGTSSGDGSVTSPWNLATALAQPSSVKAGDSIWLRNGTYVGHFTSSLKGLPNKPVVVRQYPGERATIDGNDGGNAVTLIINGSYAWYWGFEVTNSDPTRTSPSTDKPARRGEGVNLLGRGTKLINVIIHDTAQGVLTTALAPDAEVYGNVIYYNGWDAPDRGHGHGVYLQNDTGVKRIVDNIIFQQFGYGIHGYTESGTLNNVYIEGNSSFNNGGLSQVSGPTTNILVGANGQPASNPDDSTKVAKKTSLVSNLTYFSIGGGTGANLGFSKGIASPTILDNYFVGSPALALVNAFRPVTMTGNSLYGAIDGFQTSEFPHNSFFGVRPTGVKTFVRPNQYEPGRAEITIYNWDRASSVDVSLNAILKVGTPYEVRNAQNYFGPPVLTGTADGSPLHLPMNGLAPATPVGRPAPSPTGPDFQVFVVVPKPAASPAKPAAASFSFAPSSPLTAEVVTFHDQTAEEATRSWDFGDPSSGTQNVSSLSDPTHSFSAPGTYRIQLTTQSDSGTSYRARDVTVTASPGSRSATLPVAGHVTGSTGTTFVTDVTVQNPANGPVSAVLVFSPSGGGAPLQKPVSLGPGETRVLADVVADQFGISDTFGSLRLDTNGASPAMLRVASRTYVQQGAGTLGFGTTALSAGDQTYADRFLSNLSVSDAFRTNVGALNGSPAAQGFALELRDANGDIVGVSNLSLNPGEQRQWSLLDLFPAADGSGLTVRLVPAGGVPAPFAYAAVTDNASSDPTYYPALMPAPVQYLPGIAGISGVGGALFRSEISIANSGNGPATVTVTFLEHDRDNTTAPTVSLVLGPFETVHADDALQTLFGLTETYGALKFESDVSPGVTVFERILTDATTTPGTVGQQVDAVSSEDLMTSGALLAIRQDSAFRSNLGLLNSSSAAAAVSLKLLRSPNTILGTASVVLPPRGYVQRNLAALFSSVTLPPGETLSIAVDGAAANSIFAFASVIDNSSQDPTYYPAVR